MTAETRQTAGPASEPSASGPAASSPAQRGAVQPVDTVSGPEKQRRRELSRLRGFNLGAAFFGWLIVVGIAALLAAVVSAAGAAIALTQTPAPSNTTTLTIVGAVLLLVILLVAYYTGGYVAGRLSRFSGAVQGLGVWVIGLLVTVALAVAGAVAGSKYNVLAQLRLPSIPVNGQSFATGAIIAVVIIAVLTLVAAIGGGIVGLRYHHRVDRALAGRAQW